MPRVAQIISTARYLPEHVVTNAELTARFDVLGKPAVIEKLAARTGITQRFFGRGGSGGLSYIRSRSPGGDRGAHTSRTEARRR